MKFKVYTNRFGTNHVVIVDGIRLPQGISVNEECYVRLYTSGFKKVSCETFLVSDDFWNDAELETDFGAKHILQEFYPDVETMENAVWYFLRKWERETGLKYEGDEPIQPITLYSQASIAKAVGMTNQNIQHYSKNGRFPVPYALVDGKPLWDEVGFSKIVEDLKSGKI